jgi:N6-L-threonylcarbamoyladenine synthase
MLPYIVDEALKEAQMAISDVDVVAVTNGPGLVGALLVGLSYAKALAYAAKKPLVGVHHIKGHIAAAYLQYAQLKPPFLCLVISGGHTNIVHVKGYCEMESLGRSRDDAVGEAFDKVARCLGLPYPGGPEIDRCARLGNAEAIDFPRVLLEKDSLDFSFSGLKSAVINYLNTKKMKDEPFDIYDVAASFQEAAIDVLCEKIDIAAKRIGESKIVLCGGVACNSRLRQRMWQLGEREGYELFVPDVKYCTDNAAMIASDAYYEYMTGKRSDILLNAEPSLKLS